MKLLSEKKVQHNKCSFYSVSRTLLVPVGTIELVQEGATNISTATARWMEDDGRRVVSPRRTGQWSSRLEGGP